MGALKNSPKLGTYKEFALLLPLNDILVERMMQQRKFDPKHLL